ncbi:MAG: hypothetical protein U0414_16480 [Polyangiaceae bacterium]
MRRRCLGILVGAAALVGCTRHDLVDAAISTAYRDDDLADASPEAARGRVVLLAGDLHCHVAPPDESSDVVRGLGETIELARRERLDFIVLTPHVGARFFQTAEGRASVAASQAELREEIARRAPGGLTLVPGFEYTDHRYGHVGVSFANLDDVLAAVPLQEAKDRPERFFEEWVARGGLLVVNHPLVTPIEGAIVPMARADLSFRPWTSKAPFPPEIEAIDRLARGFEVFNLAATELRDRLLLGEAEDTIDETFEALDAKIPEARRRMTPVGGSDSHSHHLRATTFALSADRSPSALRDAIVQGRTCVRSRAACSFEVRPTGGEWETVGATFEDGGDFDVRAHGEAIDVYVDGRWVASPESDEIARVALPTDRCSVVRARVDEGFSAPIYVHCGIRAEGAHGD